MSSGDGSPRAGRGEIAHRQPYGASVTVKTIVCGSHTTPPNAIGRPVPLMAWAIPDCIVSVPEIPGPEGLAGSHPV